MSFDTPHRGIALEQTIGACAIHGYVIMRGLPESALNFPTLLAEPQHCYICQECYINDDERMMMSCGHVMHSHCMRKQLLLSGTYVCPLHGTHYRLSMRICTEEKAPLN